MKHPPVLDFSQQETFKSAPQYEGELIDSERIKMLESAVGKEVFVEIAELFMAETRNGMKKILSALETQTCIHIANKSHTIKSSAATLGCMSLAELLEDIEREAKEQQLENLYPLITRKEQDYVIENIKKFKT